LRLQSYKKGDVIFTEGSHGTDAFVIHIGEVDILKSGANEQLVVLSTLGPGEMFGEMALITNNARAATASARTDVTLEVINRNAFGLKMQSDPDFAMQTVRRLAGMVPEAQARLLAQARTAMAESGEADSRRSRFGRRRDVAKEVDAFAPDYIQIEQEPVPLAVRLAGLTVLGLLVGTLLWSIFAFTDTTVTGSGKVVSTVPNVVVQPFDNGIVRQVNAKEGQLVRKGQVLATLDATLATADVKSTSQQLESTEAQIARLQAELSGKAPERFSKDATEEAMQRQLFTSRMQQLRATLLSHDEEIRNLSGQIAARQQEAKDLERQLVVLREITKVREEFFRKERDAFQRDGQYRLQYLDALRAQTAAEREAAQVGSAVASIETQIRTKRAQRDAYQSDWLAKANGELVTAQRDAARLQEQFRKFDHAQSLVEITAPADAIVLSVKTRTPGAVLKSAEVLFELVPVDVPLEVELDVSPRDVAQMQKDDDVTIKIDALPFVKHGTVPGKLRFISEDTFDKTLTGQQGPVYRARVTVGKLELTGTPPGFRLVPGMTVTGDVKVGSRRLVTYITYPVTRAFSTSFREP
jgi:HlyD family secretion protein